MICLEFVWEAELGMMGDMLADSLSCSSRTHFERIRKRIVCVDMSSRPRILRYMLGS